MCKIMSCGEDFDGLISLVKECIVDVQEIGKHK